ncbi:DNA replication factor Cdt1-like [Anneissia japonica]|uniref:DNA replication factor Cdt1-like n=1 Tax=Anneissia japonica TaxID=1529436 RepID=UPI00142572F2|nr:DNA replication factor Cdt1-like [Anneissia japonica]
MAQTKVTFYYGSRKRSLDIQPSKRRKVTYSNSSMEASPVFNEDNIEISGKPVFTFSQQKPGPELQQSADTNPKLIAAAAQPTVVPTQTKSTRKKSSVRSRRKPKTKKGEKTGSSSIKDFMSTITGLQSTSDVELRLSDTGSESSGPKFEITEANDDHGIPRTPPSTPTKRGKTVTAVPVALKRSKTISKETSSEDLSGPESVQFRTYKVAGRKTAKKCLDGALAKFSVDEESALQQTPTEELSASTKVSQGSKQISSKSASLLKTPMKDKVENMIKKVAVTNKQVAVVSEAKNAAKSSAQVMREKLAKCGKLEELQKRLAAVREETQKIKEEDAQKALKKQAPKTKDESKIMPAYQKYHSLATPPPATLALPYKYKILHEMFRSMDTVVSMLHNRSEQCTFKKLKDAVQEMCRKTFQLHHVGQIKKVYSTAYNFCQRKNSAQQQRERSKGESDYQLNIDPNVSLGDSGGTVTKAGQPRVIASALIERRNIFHSNLVDIVKEHHKEFLARLPQPISIPDKQLKRWHPKFPLDQVPDIQPDDLPQPPNVLKYHTAKDVLDKAKDMMSPRVARALHLVAENSDKFKNDKNKQKGSDKPSTSKGSEVKGVSKSLLDRIRAKEAKRIEQLLVRDPKEDKKLAMMERLPEMCGIIRNFFLSEKKAALLIESAVDKLRESSRSSLSQVEAEEHINLLAEMIPDWIKVVNLRKEKYIKIDKKKELNQVNAKLTQLIKECK